MTGSPRIAIDIRVRGVVQGVGFRPFIYKLAIENQLSGWVLNDADGVKIHLQGKARYIAKFIQQMPEQLPPAARIDATEIEDGVDNGSYQFEIVESISGETVTVRIAPDMTICAECETDLKSRPGRYFNYPYVNCTNCGPRFSIIKTLPYDRAGTTMSSWQMCEDCRREYDNPLSRRFHAQPVGCTLCGPAYVFQPGLVVFPDFAKSIEHEAHRSENDPEIYSYQSNAALDGSNKNVEAIKLAVEFINDGKIVAIKSIGGYHLVCDARNDETITKLRSRKYRKDKPFAVMVKNLETANQLVRLTPATKELLSSVARPIVLAPSKIDSKNLAPDNINLGVLLPYTPLHLMLFDAGCPDAIVTTSANKSSEPIAYVDEDAIIQLEEIADAFLIGQRQIARRMDDSVVGLSKFGTAVSRRARGYAPGVVATLPSNRPILALGADLKNTITLVVGGQAFVSQHIGDLEQAGSFQAFKETVKDLIDMYRVELGQALVVHDAHPTYFSTQYAIELASHKTIAVQHHHAHVASVLAERASLDLQVLGIAFDGTGYGEDKAIWGGEFFVGSVASGFERVGHLLYASLPGGDATAQFPPQAAAGFLHGLNTPDLTEDPFRFPERYLKARELLRGRVRCFPTSSMGRLFDAVAALCGFTREIAFEAQAAIWLEFQARQTNSITQYEFEFDRETGILDWRPVLMQIIEDRLQLKSIAEIARGFHVAVTSAIVEVSQEFCSAANLDTVVLSGGVFQNELLLELLHARFTETDLRVWTNNVVPANDGGISLGQAALASKGEPT